MIEQNVTIHDRFQFEMKLNYKPQGEKSFTRYDIATWIFIPGSLDINRRTYMKDDFYNDIQTHIRFKTPTVPLRNVAKGEDSPFGKLAKSFDGLTARNGAAAEPDAENQVKIFCCIVKSAIRDHISLIGRHKDPQNTSYLVAEYVKDIEEITSKYRALRRTLRAATTDNRKFSKYLFGDEYISLLVESYTFGLLDRVKVLKDTSGDSPDQEKLLDLIRKETEYRRENGYRSIPSEDSTNEVFLFRRGVLKKFAESILYLNTRTKREGILVEQIIFGSVAGLAMAFATAVAFFSQAQYGNFTAPFFVALVVSYMFKDRLKDLMRTYVSNKLRNVLFDHRMKILVGAQKIGETRESFDFLEESRLSEEVRKIRDMDHITEIENDLRGEKIILYHKQVEILSNRLREVYHNFPIEGINDIMRFNVSRFLYRMDNPKQSLPILLDRGYGKTSGERVYHLNMVVRYSMGTHARYDRFRIVLNKDGIKRIEAVAPQPSPSLASP